MTWTTAVAELVNAALVYVGAGQRRKRPRGQALTHADKLKTLYATGDLTLDAFSSRVEAHLAAGSLDTVVPGGRSPADAAARWQASAKAANWTTPERDAT